MLDTSSAVQADEGTKTVKAICRMCHGGCGTIVSIKNGVVQSVVGDPENPVNYGKLCSKAGKASLEQLYHHDRIDRPMTADRREGRRSLEAHQLGRSHLLHRAEDARDPRRVRRGSDRLRARRLHEQQPDRDAIGQRLRHAEHRLDQLLLLRPARGRMLGNVERNVQRPHLGHGRHSRFLQRAKLHRRMGLAEAHQQRPWIDRPHACHAGAAAQAREHHRRSTQARGLRSRRYLAGTAAGHGRGHGTGVDQCDHRGRALRPTSSSPIGAMASRRCGSARSNIGPKPWPTSRGAEPRTSGPPPALMRGRSLPPSPGAPASTISA